MSGETIECAAHKWHFPPDEVCPVCEGIEFEKERIIKLLEGQIHGCSGYDCDSCDDSSQIVDLIELIKGETNG